MPFAVAPQIFQDRFDCDPVTIEASLVLHYDVVVLLHRMGEMCCNIAQFTDRRAPIPNFLSILEVRVV